MNLDRATIAFAPHTTSDCFDLGVMFFGRHLTTMLTIWLVVAVPTSLALYMAASQFEVGLPLAALVVFFATFVLGMLVCLAVIPIAFGEPMSSRAFVARLRRQGPKLLLKGLLLRAAIAGGLALGILPGLWLAARTGFFVEKACLSYRDGQLHDRQTDDLLGRQTGNLVARICSLFFLAGLFWTITLITCDELMNVLFGTPILLRRILNATQSVHADRLIGNLLWSDPLVLATASATALLVYSLVRLAWFFCYIDVRVRHDRWDMELDFRREATRLSEPT